VGSVFSGSEPGPDWRERRERREREWGEERGRVVERSGK
jgi:hypothetical protein